jgi:LmbE family N-acetylglucosaminyl deacetylase
MLPLNLAAPGRRPLQVLCLGAHSDDIEIGCGGTILRLLAEEGDVDIHWIVLSADDVREKEARTSAVQFLSGARRSEVVVRRFRNGYFPFVGDEIKDFFESLKVAVVPDLIFTHYRDDRHQDHRVVSDLTWNTFRNHTILEYEIPKYDGDLGVPNLFVPLTEADGAAKIRILQSAFASQQDKHWFDERTFSALMRLRGIESCAPAALAEAFYARKIVLGR